MLKQEELVVLCRCSICSLQAMCGKKTYPPMAEIEKKVKEILSRYGMGEKDMVSLKEFQSLVSKDIEILQLLKSFQLINSDDLREVMELETDIVECDSDIDEEIEVRNKSRTEDIQSKMKLAADLVELMNDPVEKRRVQRLEVNREMCKKSKLIPLVYKDAKPDPEYPGFFIEQAFVYGFRGFDTRNVIKISPTADLITFSGKIVWLFDSKTNQQSFFNHHKQEIGCLANYDHFVATGELGPEPSIHIWRSNTLKLMFSLHGLLKEGIAHLCFSNDGKKLAALEAGPNRTLMIFNFSLLQSSKSFNFKEHVISFCKAPQKVHCG